MVDTKKENLRYKLGILIPCFNEEKTLKATVLDLPKNLDQIKNIDVIVVDDGSTDQTREVAESLGCHVVRHKYNKGLGQAFRTGINEALRRHHVIFSGMNLVRVLMIYKPLHLFSSIAVIIGLPGIFLIFRFLYFYMSGIGSGHIQSLIIASILILTTLLVVVIGVVSFLVGINRSILERMLKYKKAEFYR